MENKELLKIMEDCGHFLWHRRGGRRGQMRILKFVEEKGEMSQKELQDILKIQSGSLSELVMKIEGRGYITKERDSRDKRRIILKITPEGKAFLKKRQEEMTREESIMFDMLSPEEQNNLESMLHKLLADWESRICSEGFKRYREERGK